MEDLGGALVLTSILECIIIIIMQVAIKKLMGRVSALEQRMFYK